LLRANLLSAAVFAKDGIGPLNINLFNNIVHGTAFRRRERERETTQKLIYE